MNLPQDDDFDPSKLLRQLVAHIEQPEKFAQTFCDAAKSQKAIDNVLKEIVRTMIKEDASTKENIKNYQKEVNKEDLIFIGKKIGFAIWSISLLIIGAIISKYT